MEASMNQRVDGSRRRLLVATALAAAGLPMAAGFPLAARAATPRVEVWRSPDCGCCGDWVEHLQANGFDVVVRDIDAIGTVRATMPDKFRSCHVARVGGYLVEGHVPAREVRRLLDEKPRAVGLSVPGMPVGSPGMDGGLYGDRKDPYDVLLVQQDGSSRVYQSYR
jgi:hypothetical protein